MAGKNSYKIDFKYNLKVFWSLLRKYRFWVALLLFLVLIEESIYILNRFLFKIIVDKGTDFLSGILISEAFIQILLIIAGVFIIVSLINIFLNWSVIHILNRVEVHLMQDLKLRFFNHIIDLDHDFHVTHKTGSLISRLMRGAGAIERISDVIIFNFAPLILQLVIAVLSIIYFDWVPALVLFITVITFLTINFFIQKAQEKSNIIVNKTEDIEKGATADIFTNIESIKYFGKEKLIKDRYKNLSENTKTNYLKNWDYFKWLSAIQSLVLSLGTFFVLYFPLMSFLNKEITLGTLTFIYSVYAAFISPMFGFVHGIRGYYRSMADFQDLFSYGKIPKQILDKPHAKDLEIKEGTVEFKNVNFSYGKRKIFSDFNLNIPKNKKIALVGHSGCGKTTLVKLLYRMYDVNSGAILIDGKNIQDVKQESLRSEMSIVPQEAILFYDTIFNNIKFSNPDATRQQVLAAIKFAQLDKIIQTFPKKENTIVGERGIKLSGGEKQRVSIARAILANKRILVLDEATSSLDSETEHEIQRDLQRLLEGRTSIMIAHRLSTIMNADRIIVMKNGNIIQQGAHNELIRQPGEYKKLWDLQKGGYIK